MDKVISQSSVQHIVTTDVVHCQVNGLLQTSVNIGPRTNELIGKIDGRLDARCVNAMESFSQSIAAGEDPAIVTQYPVFAAAAKDAIVASSADNVIILAVAKENVIT